jgi:hypothetical protein
MSKHLAQKIGIAKRLTRLGYPDVGSSVDHTGRDSSAPAARVVGRDKLVLVVTPIITDQAMLGASMS